MAYLIGDHMYGGDVLSHHGILGMKWGVRRFQNEDGTRTAAGKARYGGNGEKRSKKLSARQQRKEELYKKARKINAMNDEGKKRYETAISEYNKSVDLATKIPGYGTDVLLFNAHVAAAQSGTKGASKEAKAYVKQLKKAELAGMSYQKLADEHNKLLLELGKSKFKRERILKKVRKMDEKEAREREKAAKTR